jgi:hypothetical protein
LKSGSLKLLEPSGPVQACNGIALTFTLKSDFSMVHTLVVLRTVTDENRSQVTEDVNNK